MLKRKKTSSNQSNHSNSTFRYFFHGGREIYRLEEKVIYTSITAFYALFSTTYFKLSKCSKVVHFLMNHIITVTNEPQ